MAPKTIGTLLMMLVTSGLLAQDRATLSGLVSDPSGAVVPGAHVELRQPSTGFVREIRTDEIGTYQIPGLAVGSYNLIVDKEGFSTAQVNNVVLTVGQRANLNVTLAVGVVQNQVVDVIVDDVQLTSNTAEIGGVVSGTELNLPLNGRNWASFMLLAPGAVNVGEGNQNSIRYFGRARDENNFTLDGVDASGVKDPPQEANLRLNISLDSIQEFRVSSGLYNAESGNGAGAQTNLVSKSGTNTFHGSLFEFFRNDKLDARRPIDVANPPFRLNQYGGNLGGPIVRDKTFFFGNYEGLQQRLTQTFIGTVPSASYKARAIATSQAIKQVMDGYPAGTSGGTDPNIDNLATVGSQPWGENSALFKVDHRFSNATSMFIRYNFDDGTITALQNALLEKQTSLFRTQNVAIQLQHLFSPNVLSETKVGMNRSALHRNTLGSFGEGISISGFTSLQADRHEVEAGTSLSLIQNVTWNHGRHAFKFGGEARGIELDLADTGIVTTTFSSRDTFVNNRADSITIAGPVPSVGVRRPYYFVYAQDEAKLSRSLTGSIGLRYEYYSVPHSKDGRGRVLDLEPCGGFCAPGTPWYIGDKKDFAPRVGLAWNVHGNTLIRAGYGIFFGPGQVDDVNAAIDSIPETYALSSRDQPSLSFPAGAFINQARSQGIAPRSLQRDRREGYSQQWTLAVEQKLPASFLTTISYVGNNGHRLFNRTFVNVIDPVTGQRPYPTFSNIDQKQNHGNSSFEGLQVSLNRALRSGFSWQTQYMWSHAINDNSGSGDGAQAMISNCRQCDRGDANWDVRHTITMNSVYQIPFGRNGHRGPQRGFLGVLLGGWDLSGISTARTGVPFDVAVSRSASDLPDGVTSTPGKKAPAQRPNLVPGVSPYPATRTIDNWLNPAAFAVPAKGTWGTLPRNALRGQGIWQVDLALAKRTSLRESIALSFRAEVFNLFNRAQYGLPNANLSNLTTFGKTTSVVNTTPTGTGGPRQVQLNLRLEF